MNNTERIIITIVFALIFIGSFIGTSCYFISTIYNTLNGNIIWACLDGISTGLFGYSLIGSTRFFCEEYLFND